MYKIPSATRYIDAPLDPSRSSPPTSHRPCFMMQDMAESAPKSRSTDPRPESVAAPKREERHAWRIAILSTGAVILAGLIAAGSSYLTARVQSNSQAQQARDDFLRSQRQVTYSRFLADEKRFFDTENNYCGGAAPNRAPEQPPAKSVAQSDELKGMLDGLDNDLFSLSLIATSDSERAAQNLETDDFTMYLYCRRNLTTPTITPVDSESNSKKQIDAWNAAVNHRSSLLKQFKADITSG
jgi:hypothetical protein